MKPVVPPEDLFLSNAELAAKYNRSQSWASRLRKANGHPKQPMGRPKIAAEGTVCSSISLSPTDWASMDKQRGNKGRSAWVREKVREGAVTKT